MKKQLLKLSAVLSAMFIFAGMAVAQHTLPNRTIEIPHVKWTGTAWEKITIDGAANEDSWSAEENVTEYWTPVPPIPLPTSDLGGTIQACYDDKNIYIFCNVSDDTACVYAGGASQWEYDNVEFFFDLDTAINLVSSLGSYNQGADATTADATQLRYNRGCDTTTGNAARNDQDLNVFAQTDAGSGWTLEVAVPFLAWMAPGAVIADLNAWVDKAMGFDVSFADSDKVPAGAGARTGQMAWDADVPGSGNEEDAAWHDTRSFGVMTLGAVPPATHSATAEGIVVYPNPAQSVLNISNLDNVASIEIVNMLGQVVKVVNEVDASALQLNIADLVSGNYVVRFHMDNGNTSYQNLAH